MTRTAIISTTINDMPNAQSWAEHMGPDDVMIVAGDLKTPHAEVRESLARAAEATQRELIYLHPDDQRGRWRTADVLPWNCIQRRNVALLAALEREPEVIITIDDDNYPVAEHRDDSAWSWVHEAHRAVTTKVLDLTYAYGGWYNPGHRCHPRVVHRGYPTHLRHATGGFTVHNSLDPVPVGVFAGLWLDDPDVDAIERIALNPLVLEVDRPNVTVDIDTWAPFNSQSTAYRTELAPLMMCLPGVGRMDDIWASYVARAVMDHVGWHVQYGHPVVVQSRNDHDLVRDLENELIGYRHTWELTRVLRDVMLPETTHTDELLTHVVASLSHLPFIPAIALDAYHAWNDDLIRIDNEHAAARLFDVARTEYHGEQL